MSTINGKVTGVLTRPGRGRIEPTTASVDASASVNGESLTVPLRVPLTRLIHGAPGDTARNSPSHRFGRGIPFAISGRGVVEEAKPRPGPMCKVGRQRSEEHTSELQSLMRISYAVSCLKKKKQLQ